MTQRPLLEVCVDSAQGLMAADQGGADRIELCSALALDGLTPSSGLMVLSAGLNRPVYAMIRPRAGDFVFSPADIDIMLRDIDAARDAGLAGVVLGACLPSGELDARTLQRLTQQAQGLGMTLHRAMDMAPAPLEALDLAIELGFERILTSGGAPTAQAGAERLAQWVQHVEGRLSIMAGSGVTPANAIDLIERTGVREIHGSCSAPTQMHAPLPGSPPFAARATRADIVADLIAALAGHCSRPQPPPSNGEAPPNRLSR